ncbi:MAG: RICIN domain-containing protein [Anaerovoracaceae bacterium]
MKKKLLSVVLSMMLIVTLIPQSAFAVDDKDITWIGSESSYKNLIDRAFPYDGTRIVRKDGLYGVVNKSGNMVVPLKYSMMADINKNTAVCSLPGSKAKGLVDIPTGRIIIPIKYANVENVGADGIAIVKGTNGYEGFYDTKSGRQIGDLKYRNVKEFVDGYAQVGLGEESIFIDKSGNEYLKGLKAKKIRLDGPSHRKGNVVVYTSPKKIGSVEVYTKTGVMNIKTGKYIVAPNQTDGYRLDSLNSKGLTHAKMQLVPEIDRIITQKDTNGKLNGGRSGVITYSGKTVIPFVHGPKEATMSRSRQVISYSPEEKGFRIDNLNGGETVGMYDKNGKTWVKQGKYSYIGTKTNGMYVVAKRTKSSVVLGAMNSSFKEVVPVKYEKFTEFNKQGYAWGKKGSIYYLFNKSGKVVHKGKYSDITTDLPSEYLSVPNTDFRYNTPTNEDGKVYIVEAKTSGARMISRVTSPTGMTVVRSGNKYGVVSATGKVIASPKYDSVGPYFDQGIIEYKKDGKCGLLSQTGREITSAKYKSFAQYRADTLFHNGVVKATKLDGTSVILNKNGTEISKSYSNIYNNRLGLNRVFEGSKYGYIDNQGREVIKVGAFNGPAFDDEDYSLIVKGGRVGYYPMNPVKQESEGEQSNNPFNGKSLFVKSAVNPRQVMDIPGRSYSDGVGIIMYADNGGLNQQFKFTKVGEYYSITSSLTKKALTVSGSGASGSAIQQRTYTGADNQLFRLKPAYGGSWQIVTKKGYYVTVSGYEPQNGAKVVTWVSLGNASQRWTISLR